WTPCVPRVRPGELLHEGWLRFAALHALRSFPIGVVVSKRRTHVGTSGVRLWLSGAHMKPVVITSRAERVGDLTGTSTTDDHGFAADEPPMLCASLSTMGRYAYAAKSRKRPISRFRSSVWRTCSYRPTRENAVAPVVDEPVSSRSMSAR